MDNRRASIAPGVNLNMWAKSKLTDVNENYKQKIKQNKKLFLNKIEDRIMEANLDQEASE